MGIFKEKIKSVRVKLFLTMSIMVIAIILFLIFANTFLIEKYYLHSKKDSLLQAYDKINTYVSNNTNISSSELELEKIAINNNFSIVITDKNNMNVYYSGKDYIENMLDRNRIDKGKILYSKDKIYIVELKDYKNEITFLTLLGKMDNGNNIYIRMPISAITENVDISNHFLYIIGVITLIVGGIIVTYISKRFTKPISELSTIANKMSNLDFSQKYRIKDNGDEIDNLGKSINTMSDKLEDTITELRKNNSELEKDIEKKSKIDEMRKQFISDVSHELKTPIGLIQGYSEGLIENVNEDEESRRFYAEVIRDEAQKMDLLVKKLLELMKIEYKEKAFKDVEFDLSELVKAEIRRETVNFKNKGIDVELNIPEKIIVYADQDCIEQVVNNYLSNAIKHCEKINNENKVEIKIEKTKKNKVRLYVYNTGRKIPKDYQNRIWGRFYKMDKSRNRDDGSTGLGLALVKAIMNNYENEFGVRNRGNGVEFYCDINIKPKS